MIVERLPVQGLEATYQVLAHKFQMPRGLQNRRKQAYKQKYRIVYIFFIIKLYIFLFIFRTFKILDNDFFLRQRL